MASSIAGVFNSIESSVPINSGSFRRIRVHLHDGAVVGRPRFPHSCSVATTNISDRVINVVQAAFTQIGDCWGSLPNVAVITLVRGERVTGTTASGGGYGDPYIVIHNECSTMSVSDMKYSRGQRRSTVWCSLATKTTTRYRLTLLPHASGVSTPCADTWYLPRWRAITAHLVGPDRVLSGHRVSLVNWHSAQQHNG